MSSRPAVVNEWRVVRLLLAFVFAIPVLAVILGVSVRLFLAVSGLAGGS